MTVLSCGVIMLPYPECWGQVSFPCTVIMYCYDDNILCYNMYYGYDFILH